MGQLDPRAATKESWNREKVSKALHDPLLLIASCSRHLVERQQLAKSISQSQSKYSEKELEALLELMDYHNKSIAQALGLPVVE